LPSTCGRTLVSGTAGSPASSAAKPWRGTGMSVNTVMSAKALAGSVRSMGGRDMPSAISAASSSSGTMLSRTSICGGKNVCVNALASMLASGNRPTGGKA